MADGDFNNLGSIVKQMHQAASQIVHDTCQELADTYSSTCAVDTGFMSSSSYISTVQEDTYGQNLTGGTPEAQANAFPDIGPPENDTTGYMSVAANYSPYLEYGTSKMPPQPAFYPAVEAVQPQFIQALGNLESQLK